MGIRCGYRDPRGWQKIIARDFAGTDSSRALEDGLLGIQPSLGNTHTCTRTATGERRLLLRC